jgi:hypothetical protein
MKLERAYTWDEDTDTPTHSRAANIRYFILMTIASAIIMALVLTDACAPAATKRGRPEFFGLVAGLEMDVGKARYACKRGPKRDGATVVTYTLTEAQRAWFIDPPESFREHPKFYDRAEGRELQRWQTGVPAPEERRLWGAAMASIYYAVNDPECDSGMTVKEAADEARLALSRPTTHYAYVFLSQLRKPLLLDFYMIDPVAGLVWVIVANGW